MYDYFLNNALERKYDTHPSFKERMKDLGVDHFDINFENNQSEELKKEVEEIKKQINQNENLSYTTVWTDEHNYYLLRETTEAAMKDAVDTTDYRINNVISINREKFIESFIRRFAENADLSNNYTVEIYDVNEQPPKVSLRVKTTKEGVVANETVTIGLNNQLSAVIEEISTEK